MAFRADQPGDPADVGLLSPVTAGTAAETSTGDPAVLAALVRVEHALLHALADRGVAPAEAAAAARLLDPTALDLRGLALASSSGGNPVIPLLEALRSLLPPSTRPWLHHGATSQDVLDTALMLVAADVRAQLAGHLQALADLLAGLTEEHRHTLAVGRTLTQQAMPITLGFRIAGWLAGVDEALARVTSLELPVSLGGPVGTAAAYGAAGPEVLERFAAHLGLAVPVAAWHTRRATVLDVCHALAAVGSVCGTLAADVLVMAQSEVGESIEGKPGGSSSMPHKRNPTRAVLVSSAARRMAGPVTVLTTSSVAENERPAGAWHAEWEPLRELLRLAGASAEHTLRLLESLRFDTDALDRNLDHLLAATGHDRAWAQEQVGHLHLWVGRMLARHEEVTG